MTKRQFNILAISVLVVPVLYAILAVLAYQQRGYFAFGGECSAFILPLCTYIYLCMRG